MLTALLTVTGLQAQNQTVTGKVTDQRGTPVIGATVTIQGTSQGTFTNANGDYSLQVADPDAVLDFYQLGYTRISQPLNSRSVIDVSLTETAIDLEEVVVVGYGAMTKKDLTGSVSTVNAEALAREQPQTVQDLLRNNVAGLHIGYNSSAEGNADEIVIRGKTNFRSQGDGSNSYNAPLIVLDDVIYYGRLTDINPNDIERLDVLKDGSSSAIYGAKAANGVIIITTKKGKQGKPVIRLDASVGLVMNARLQPSWGPDDFMQFRTDASRFVTPFEGQPNYYNDPRKLSGGELAAWMGTSGGDPVDVWLSRLGFTTVMQDNFKAGKTVDWKDLMYNDIALRQDYTISVSGRSGNTSHYTSVGYTDNKTNVKGSGFRSIKARVNLESKATDFITYGLNSQFANQDRSPIGVGTGYSSLTPYDSPYEEDGKTLLLIPSGGGWVTNPLLTARYTDRFDNTSILSATGFIKIALPFGFSIETRFSPYLSYNQFYSHQSSEHPQWVGTTNNYVRRNNNNYYRQQWDNLLKWNKTFGKHKFDFTYLMNWEKQNNWLNQFQGNDFAPNDNLGYHGMQWATSVTAIPDYNYDQVRTSDALMARLNYSYDSRYSATVAYRRDGDSAFGKLNPRAHFFSGALAWNFTEEAFWPKNEWFTYGKLRFSYGENGNREIGLYSALMNINSEKYLYILNGSEQLLNVYYASSMANHRLRWEKTTSYNFALDFAMFNDRLSGTIDVYKKVTNDLITGRQVPNITGYTSVTSNIGEVQNAGIEVMLNSRNISQKDFTWDTQFTFSYNKNRINSLYGLTDENGKLLDDTANGRFIGKSMDEIWDYKVLGVWQENEAAEAERFGRRPGDFKLDKTDWESNTFVETEDKQFLGSKVPLYRMSMRNSFTFLNNITFSFNMYSYLGHYQTFNRAKNDDANMGTAAVGQAKTKYWTPENPTNEYGRLGSKSAQGFNVWRKADFVKIDNITIGYDLPSKLLTPLRIQALNVSATLRNGILMTGWPGEDPEGGSPIYVYFGLNATF